MERLTISNITSIFPHPAGVRSCFPSSLGINGRWECDDASSNVEGSNRHDCTVLQQ